MRKLVFGTALAAVVLMCANLAALETIVMDQGGMRVGGHFSMGIANAGGDYDDSPATNAQARFAGGFGFNFNYFVLPFLALDGGIGFMGKGYRQTEDVGGPFGSNDIEIKTKFFYMEIPLGVMFEFINIQVGIYLVLNFALAGKVKGESGGTTFDNSLSGSDWDNYRRFNISPKLYAGYAIPIRLPFGTFYVIPGVDFSVHLINDLKGDLDNNSFRALNVMFRVGVAYQF